MEFGKSVYVCKKITKDGGYVEYSKPIEIILRPMHLSIMPAYKGELGVLPYGVDKDAKWIGIAYNQFSNFFHEGDLIYLEGAKPSDDEEEYGKKANGIIVAVRPYNLTLRIIIKERVVNYEY